MSAFSFSKLIPGGNATIILTDPGFPPGRLPDISARLMSPTHIQAEQVGALHRAGRAPAPLPGTRPDLPHLQMMGGEFCVNATRCATLLLAREGWLSCLVQPERPNGVWGGELTVSGMDRQVQVLAAFESAALEAALAMGLAEFESIREVAKHPVSTPMPDIHRLYCAAHIECAESGVSLFEHGPGVTLVSLPGILHLLVDASRHPLPDMHSPAWRRSSAAWREICGIAGSPASGVVWYERRDNGYGIWPAVEVLATNSEHLESACGSASLAMALVHSASARKTVYGTEQAHGAAAAAFTAVDVLQPSGESLRVLLKGASSGPPESAWIAGIVSLAAEGTAYA